jgi:hypothetical protein
LTKDLPVEGPREHPLRVNPAPLLTASITHWGPLSGVRADSAEALERPWAGPLRINREQNSGASSMRQMRSLSPFSMRRPFGGTSPTHQMRHFVI